jgi:hypothetical protein
MGCRGNRLKMVQAMLMNTRRPSTFVMSGSTRSPRAMRAYRLTRPTTKPTNGPASETTMLCQARAGVRPYVRPPRPHRTMVAFCSPKILKAKA